MCIQMRSGERRTERLRIKPRIDFYAAAIAGISRRERTLGYRLRRLVMRFSTESGNRIAQGA